MGNHIWGDPCFEPWLCSCSLFSVASGSWPRLTLVSARWRSRWSLRSRIRQYEFNCQRPLNMSEPTGDCSTASRMVNCSLPSKQMHKTTLSDCIGCDSKVICRAIPFCITTSILRSMRSSLYIERRASTGSADAARVAGSTDARSAITIMIRTPIT